MSTEPDLTYYSAQPPQMTDPRELPPLESLPGLLGEADLALDDVVDPDFPWQLLPHDSPGGRKRMEDIKAKKAVSVASYRMRHERMWRQFRQPKSVASPSVETVSYTTGRARRQNTTIDQGIETHLGLKAGSFQAGMKHSLRWTSDSEASFSESVTRTIEQSYEGNSWYFYWQTLDVLTLYRRTVAAPGELVEASTVCAPSGLVMVDRYQRPAAGKAQVRRLEASGGSVTLKKGQSYSFGGYVFGSTKVTIKNPSSNDDGELTIVWMGIGSKVVVAVPPDTTQTHEKWIPASFRAINSGVTDLEVWTDA